MTIGGRHHGHNRAGCQHRNKSSNEFDCDDREPKKLVFREDGSLCRPDSLRARLNLLDGDLREAPHLLAALDHGATHADRETPEN